MTFREDIYRGRPYEEWIEAQKHILSEDDLARRREAQQVFAHRPYLVRTSGPVEFSTSTVLCHWPQIVWDVNGYYRDLGVQHFATVAELRRAYQEKGGERSARLTYVLRQLLNPSVRRAYDSTLPGQVFYDAYVDEYVRRQMLADEYRDHGLIRSFEQRVADGDQKIDLSAYMDRVVDLDAGLLDSSGGGVVGSSRWHWSYYQWHTSVNDFDRLRTWQQMLIRVWGSPAVNLCVGLSDTLEDAHLETIGFRQVAFINVHVQPTEDLALKIRKVFPFT